MDKKNIDLKTIVKAVNFKFDLQRFANGSGILYRDTTSNYLGELFLVGQNATPFLNMLGGIEGGRAKTTPSFTFPTSQAWSLETASQPAITEAQSVAGATPSYYDTAQAYNTVQIFQRAIEVSYARQSTSGELAGIQISGQSPIQDMLAFQKMANLKQIAIDANTSFLNGAYQAGSSSTTAAKTRGVITATSTNAINASSAALTKVLIDQLLRTMVGNGAPLDDAVIFVNAFQKQKLSDIYAYAPMDRNIGGYNIKQIETDFGMIGVVFEPAVPAATLALIDMAHCYPVFCLVPGKPGGGYIFYEDLGKPGASQGGQIYGQVGIAYGYEKYHGKITSLATS